MRSVRSFAKINLGLKIGQKRSDGFHELRTIYQTIALHDVIRVDVLEGNGIEIRCDDARVPRDATNTCHKIAERVMRAVNVHAHVVITLEKRLPVQGGLGAASSNAVAAMIALEQELRTRCDRAAALSAASAEIAGMNAGMAAFPEVIPAQNKVRIAAEVGSDLPLFLIGGTVLGVDHGQEVYPVQDLPAMPLVVVTPPLSVSTPKAFAQWDALVAGERGPSTPLGSARDDSAMDSQQQTAVIVSKGAHSAAESKGRPEFAEEARYSCGHGALTLADPAGTITTFSQSVFAWLGKSFLWQAGPAAGVPARGGNRAETPLLDLVRTGIENDFERVVFPEHPELREVKRVLEREGAVYASLSGSGSTLYGIFGSAGEANSAAQRMSAAGYSAVATTTLTRAEYWKNSGQSIADGG